MHKPALNAVEVFLKAGELLTGEVQHMHILAYTISSVPKNCISGLWHHRQRRWQPLRKRSIPLLAIRTRLRVISAAKALFQQALFAQIHMTVFSFVCRTKGIAHMAAPKEQVIRINGCEDFPSTYSNAAA